MEEWSETGTALSRSYGLFTYNFAAGSAARAALRAIGTYVVLSVLKKTSARHVPSSLKGSAKEKVQTVVLFD